MTQSPAVATRRVGAAAMLASGLGFGMSGVFTRSIEGGAWEIASWRGLAATPVVVAYVWWHRWRDGDRVRVRVRLEFVSAAKALVLLALNATAMVLLVTSLQKTAVANVSVIMATIPFMAAGLGWLILREGLRRSTVVAAVVSFGGVILTVVGSLGAGNLEGDLLAVALFAYVGFADRADTPLPGHRMPCWLQAGSGIALFAVALVVADPFGMDASEMPLTVAFGLVFAVSLVLWTEGVRRIRAAEAALLATTETPSSILAAWIVVSEAPPLATVIGGLLIVGAVITQPRADWSTTGSAVHGSAKGPGRRSSFRSGRAGVGGEEHQVPRPGHEQRRVGSSCRLTGERPASNSDSWRSAMTPAN